MEYYIYFWNYLFLQLFSLQKFKGDFYDFPFEMVNIEYGLRINIAMGYNLIIISVQVHRSKLILDEYLKLQTRQYSTPGASTAQPIN